MCRRQFPPFFLWILMVLVYFPVALALHRPGTCERELLKTGSQYLWTERPHGLLAGESVGDALIYTVEGCATVCGMHTPELYPWLKISGTLTTWTLPAASLTLAAPFESNNFWLTMLFFFRLLGSPVAVLACTLRNIRVRVYGALTRAVVLKSTKAFPRGVPRPQEEGETFHQLRDSTYILSVMNQYIVNISIPARDLNTLLRRALFSAHEAAIKARSALASDVRKQRWKGVIQIFLGLLWFATAFAISVEAAFGSLGEDTTAHSLAMGLFLAWLPVIIISTITDRNPTDADAIKNALNNFIAESVSVPVRTATAASQGAVNHSQYPQPAHTLPPGSSTTGRSTPPANLSAHPLTAEAPRLALLPTVGSPIPRPVHASPCPELGGLDEPGHHEIFQAFAGQGRLRWHRGIAYDFLRTLNTQFPPEEHNFRFLYTSGQLTTNLDSIAIIRSKSNDRRLQVVSAVSLLLLSVGGAFLISFRTPTIGLGCRSGGYMIYTLMCLTPLALELALPPVSSKRRSSFHHFTGGQSIRLFILMSVLEIFSALALLGILLTQTVGFYNTCWCRASMMGHSIHYGGYLDYEGIEFSKKFGVEKHWKTGMGMGVGVMGVGLVYLLWEWGSQSFLWTQNQREAEKGFRVTRIVRIVMGWWVRPVIWGWRRVGGWRLKRRRNMLH